MGTRRFERKERLILQGLEVSEQLLALRPKPQAGGSLFVGRLRLLTQAATTPAVCTLQFIPVIPPKCTYVLLSPAYDIFQRQKAVICDGYPISVCVFSNFILIEDIPLC